MAITERTFDRIVHFDARSRDYSVRRGGYVPPTPRRRKMWTPGHPIDQGREGACVGYAWTNELAATPVRILGLRDRFASQVYRDAQRVDPWPGEAYEGTSVLAGAKVMRSRGFLREYRWCFGVDDVIDTIIRRGPVVLGVNWYDSAYQTRPSGLVDLSGRVVGGHAILAYGYRPSITLAGEGGRAIEAVALRNSWGPSWGLGGSGWVEVSALDRWLRDDGEACAPVIRSYNRARAAAESARSVFRPWLL